MLLKQQKPNEGQSFDLSSLTLEERDSPVEDMVTNISSSKVELSRSHMKPLWVVYFHYIGIKTSVFITF